MFNRSDADCKPKVLHISTVHPRDDSRIRAKQLRSIVATGRFDAAMLVQDGLEEEVDAVGRFSIHSTGPKLRRISRMALGGLRMVRETLRARPDIVHFHDPELMPWGMLISLFGPHVIYDVHEDYRRAVQHNNRLPAIVRAVIGPMVAFVEWTSQRLFSGIVAVDETIAAHFSAHKTIIVRNFAIVSEFHEPGKVPFQERPREFAYIGTITANRNIMGMLDAFALAQDVGAIFRLAGEFTVEADRQAAHAHKYWPDVRFEGWVDRAAIANMLGSVRAGLLLIKPIPHEMDGLPIKLFEYMAAGVPIIASNFPLWRSIIEETGAGLIVDPENPTEIAEAIRWILANPEEAFEMGQRGREAVLDRYNWDREASKLLALYDRILYRQPHTHSP
jgi:glycosyltransferase involved in cell wall biosynthesis